MMTKIVRKYIRSGAVNHFFINDNTPLCGKEVYYQWKEPWRISNPSILTRRDCRLCEIVFKKRYPNEV